MLRQYENSIDDKRQFTALVKDIFPEEAKNINLILMAYNMGIAQDIQKANLLNEKVDTSTFMRCSNYIEEE